MVEGPTQEAGVCGRFLLQDPICAVAKPHGRLPANPCFPIVPVVCLLSRPIVCQIAHTVKATAVTADHVSKTHACSQPQQNMEAASGLP